MTRWEEWDSVEQTPTTPAPRTVGDLVAGLTRNKRWEKRLRAARIHQVWEEVAGAELARHVEPVRLAGGVLVVRAESAGWATQVRYLSGELAQRANAVLGEGEVRQVRVQGGGSAQRRD